MASSPGDQAAVLKNLTLRSDMARDSCHRCQTPGQRSARVTCSRLPRAPACRGSMARARLKASRAAARSPCASQRGRAGDRARLTGRARPSSTAIGGVSLLRLGVVRAVRRRRRLLDLADHVHARDHPSEGREALAVGVALAAEVERRLVVDADEPARGGAVGGAARHRHRAVHVLQPGDAGALERDGAGSRTSTFAVTPAWITSILTVLSGWLSIFTVRWKVPPS